MELSRNANGNGQQPIRGARACLFTSSGGAIAVAGGSGQDDGEAGSVYTSVTATNLVMVAAGQMVEARAFTLTARFAYNGDGARVTVAVEGYRATTYTLDLSC